MVEPMDPGYVPTSAPLLKHWPGNFRDMDLDFPTKVALILES